MGQRVNLNTFRIYKNIYPINDWVLKKNSYLNLTLDIFLREFLKKKFNLLNSYPYIINTKYINNTIFLYIKYYIFEDIKIFLLEKKKKYYSLKKKNNKIKRLFKKKNLKKIKYIYIPILSEKKYYKEIKNIGIDQKKFNQNNFFKNSKKVSDFKLIDNEKNVSENNYKNKNKNKYYNQGTKKKNNKVFKESIIMDKKHNNSDNRIFFNKISQKNISKNSKIFKKTNDKNLSIIRSTNNNNANLRNNKTEFLIKKYQKIFNFFVKRINHYLTLKEEIYDILLTKRNLTKKDFKNKYLKKKDFKNKKYIKKLLNILENIQHLQKLDKLKILKKKLERIKKKKVRLKKIYSFRQLFFKKKSLYILNSFEKRIYLFKKKYFYLKNIKNRYSLRKKYFFNTNKLKLLLLTRTLSLYLNKNIKIYNINNLSKEMFLYTNVTNSLEYLKKYKLFGFFKQKDYFQPFIRFFLNIITLKKNNANILCFFIKRCLELPNLINVRDQKNFFKFLEILFKLFFFNPILGEFFKNKQNIIGFKIKLKGKINGKPRKKKIIIQYGKISTTTIYQNIDYSYEQVITKTGVFGLKIWLFYENTSIKN